MNARDQIAKLESDARADLAEAQEAVRAAQERLDAIKSIRHVVFAAVPERTIGGHS